VLVTDGEDDMINPEAIRAAKAAFREVKAILEGGSNEVIEAHLPAIKINMANPESLREVLKNI